MITNNQLEKSFGPVGSIAGITIFIAGLYATTNSLTGIVLLLIGAFFGFTSSSALIDEEKKRVKLSTNIFGVIKTGQWLDLDPNMKLGIKKSNRYWRAYSRSNRTLDIPDTNFRLVLYDSSGKPLLPLKKEDTLDSAKISLDCLSKQLGLVII